MQIVINEEKPYMFELGNTRFYGFIAAMSSDSKAQTVRNLGLVNYKIDVNYNDRPHRNHRRKLFLLRCHCRTEPHVPY